MRKRADADDASALSFFRRLIFSPLLFVLAVFMKDAERRQTPILAVDFRAVESQIDDIFARADEKLRRLLEDATVAINAANVGSQGKASSMGALGSFEIRLGSTRISLKELSEKKIGDIEPLIDSQKGQVQIWSEGKMRATGVLLVDDGKLAVRVEKLVDETNV